MAAQEEKSENHYFFFFFYNSQSGDRKQKNVMEINQIQNIIFYKI